ncbi:MAG TPA: zf-HC2 domain-containing protein [Gemmatimonadaceae bacterium]|nr:zf-HC2 domain-containing protein [Gemmatimonadaceae bacterium]
MARLLEHLDGELPPSLDTWVREHLAVCEACLARTKHQRAFLRAVRSRRTNTPATEALKARIERTLRTRGERSERDD